MRPTFNRAGTRLALRLGVLATAAVALALGMATPAKADYGWRGPHHRHHGGYGYYGYRPPPVYRYVPPPPVYYAPAPVYRYVPPPPVYYAPPSIGFGVTIY